MKTVDFIREHNACREGAEWALSVSDDMAVVWDELVKQGNHEWLLWTATSPGVFPDSALRKLACRFVRETPLRDGGTVWDLLTAALATDAAYCADGAADAARAAADAAHAAARAAYCAAGAAESARAARAAVCVVHAVGHVARAAYDAAKSAQVRMIAELGNPFKKGADK